MKRKWLIGIAIIIAIGILWFYDVQRFLTLDAIRSFVDQFGFFAPLVFGIIYFFAVVFLLPASLFTVISGTLFGPLWGTVIVVIASTLAAWTAFLIARRLGGEAIYKRGEGGLIHKLVNRIDKEVAKNGFKAFFIARCLFLPYIAFSYASGLVKAARAKDFVLATFFTNIIFSFAFVYLGDQLLEGPKALILPVILIVIVLSVPRIVKRFKKI